MNVQGHARGLMKNIEASTVFGVFLISMVIVRLAMSGQYQLASALYGAVNIALINSNRSIAENLQMFLWPIFPYFWLLHVTLGIGKGK